MRWETIRVSTWPFSARDNGTERSLSSGNSFVVVVEFGPSY